MKNWIRMPVRALIVEPAEPLVRGVRWQSWPYGTTRPEFHTEGSIGLWSNRGTPKPISHWLKELERHRPMYPQMEWKPMDDCRSR